MKKLLLVSSIIIGIIITGCTCKPEVKYVYVKEKCPTLQTVDLKELNLSNKKPLQLHIKVKDGEN